MPVLGIVLLFTFSVRGYEALQNDTSPTVKVVGKVFRVPDVVVSDQIIRKTPEAIKTDFKKASPVKSYEYIVKRGDSYTRLARRATIQYTYDNEIVITPIQRLFIEDSLIQDLKSKKLELNSKVSFDVSKIEEFLRKSEELSVDRQMALQAYL